MDYIEQQLSLISFKSLCDNINKSNINLDTVDKYTFYCLVNASENDHYSKYKQYYDYQVNLNRKNFDIYDKETIDFLFKKHCYYLYKAPSLIEKQCQIVKYDSDKFKLVKYEEKSKQNLFECKNTSTIGLELAKSFTNEKKGNLMQQLSLKWLNKKS